MHEFNKMRRVAAGLGFTLICGLAQLGMMQRAFPAAVEASVFNVGAASSAALPVPAESPAIQVPARVVPLGDVFGVKLFTDGVIVVSLAEISTPAGLRCPAADAGVHPGDYILSVNGEQVSGNGGLARLIAGAGGAPLELALRRGDSTVFATVYPVSDGSSLRTGMWVRDSAAGIGTLSFYDPASGRFAGLGHGICDMDLAQVMDLKSGQPAEIALCGVVRGEAGAPGMLRGFFPDEDSLGSLYANNETGVYGTLDSPPAGEAVEVLPRGQVRTGPVQVLATVDESGPRLYDAEIKRITAPDEPTKNLVLRITDPALLEITGGIVQGMSGCPVLQDGKLAAVVTHVFTDDPTMGYGIFAQTMCEALAAAP